MRKCLLPLALFFFFSQARASDLDLAQIAAQYFPGAQTQLPEKRIFRLTQRQLDNTARSLLPGLNIPPITKYLPTDNLQNGYEYSEIISFNPANTGAYQSWVKQIAEQAEHRKGTILDCESEGNSEACLRRETDRFLRQAFRDETDPSRRSKFADLVVNSYQKNGLAAARSDLIEVSLNSPRFLFREELATENNGQLKPNQLTQNLSYTLADLPPHSFAKHRDSVEKTRSDILASNEAREKLLRFFKSWLEVRDPEDFKISSVAFPEFNATFAKNLVADLDRFLREKLGEPNPKLKDITQGILNPHQPEGSNEPKRLGIFSHPAVIASHSGPTDNRPMHRGNVWAKKFLCLDMQPPPGNEDIKPPEFSKLQTQRETYEKLTSLSKCTGCHNALNPLGFFLGNYDALGRWKNSENGKPIDARMKLDFLDEGPVRTNQPNESLSAITNSMMFKQCFIRQLFRFYMGRDETPSDHPLLRKMFFEFVSNDNQSLLRLLDTMTNSARFSSRQSDVQADSQRSNSISK